MKAQNEKIPDPKQVEKEISDFLSKRFGENVKFVSPLALPQELGLEKSDHPGNAGQKINFSLMPEDLISYLDRFIVKQEAAKTILATKVCTHFNRVKRAREFPETGALVGGVKNNILMIGPTGVGKTYMIRLIAQKLGVPFVKGDATKFSETGYVGGDVEDLVRDLVREADGDIELAEHGIIYIDEIDKIASSHDFIGADVSRTGVQRALLKPMEETEVELKVPHDPISMIQEIERFRKTGKRDQRAINTKNILFIMSGAFQGLAPVIKKRIQKQGIGFGALISGRQEQEDLLKHAKSEDFIEYGFESEFIGRLPVKAVFDRLTEADLFDILKNPNNPIILGKKLDFAAYGIDIKFASDALQSLAQEAFKENTGARGLVSAIERALIPFERRLPSTHIKQLPITRFMVENAMEGLKKILDPAAAAEMEASYAGLLTEEQAWIREYVQTNRKSLSEKYDLALPPSRTAAIANFYSSHVMDIGKVMERIKGLYEEVKKIELYFFKNHDINIVLEEDAIDHIIEQMAFGGQNLDTVYKKLTADFEYGLKLLVEKTGRNRFFLTRNALLNPEIFLDNLIRDALNQPPLKPEKNG